MPGHDAYAKKSVNTLGVGVTGFVIVLAVILVSLHLWQSRQNLLSEDAVISANFVNVAAGVAGRIQSIDVVENERVKAGDLLFSIDPKPLQLLVDQTRADLEIAQAALAAQARSLKAETQNAAIADDQIMRARTNLALAQATLTRLEALRPQGYASQQQVDDARTLRDDAQVSLSQALKQAQAANDLVGTLESSQALVRARQAAYALALHNLENTKVTAPYDGFVVGLFHAPGQIVAPGQSLFILIDAASWYASATYRETDLEGIAVGDCATVRILADSSVAVQGRVEGIGRGVSSEEILNVPRNLPFIPKSLDWVRIAQRFPVRIKLINPPDDLVRAGASAVVSVHHGQSC
ncbi:multidrug transporter subunit MdtN [Aquamicrobium segne]|uniref:Multidrug transporter subunit MdtN n=1 Tax=Aquamicrobium segne TaxID=469547 RepID=A0ABW0H5X8_9HYPH